MFACLHQQYAMNEILFITICRAVKNLKFCFEQNSTLSILDVLLQWSVGRRDAAVTVFRVVQSLGLALVFLLDVYLTLLNVICACCGVLLLGVIFYLCREVTRAPQVASDPLPFAL